MTNSSKSTSSFSIGDRVGINRFPHTIDPKATHRVIGFRSDGYIKITPIGFAGLASYLPPSDAIKY